MLKTKSMIPICIITIIGSIFVQNIFIPTKVYAKESNLVETSSDKEVVNIPDSKLREVINYTLGKDKKSNEPITKSQIESIKELISDKAIDYLPREQWIENVSHDRGIRSIEGLQYAKNLEKLDLSENGIKDLTPLKNLTKLTYIELDRNMLRDLTPLSNLINLKHLNIYNNDYIVDMEPISNLTKLEWLDLHWCNRGKKTVNVQPLGKLINMRELNLESNLVQDISFTKTLNKLTLIGVGANNIIDMSPLSHLIMKSYVDWDGTYVGMLAQNLKDTININLDYKKNTYKLADPVKGLDGYMKANECTPEVVFLAGQENKDISLNYNNETKEIEVTLNENLGQASRNINTIINLDYGFYCIGIKLNINQDVNLKFKNAIDIDDKISNEKKSDLKNQNNKIDKEVIRHSKETITKTIKKLNLKNNNEINSRDINAISLDKQVPLRKDNNSSKVNTYLNRKEQNKLYVLSDSQNTQEKNVDKNSNIKSKDLVEFKNKDKSQVGESKKSEDKGEKQSNKKVENKFFTTNKKSIIYIGAGIILTIGIIVLLLNKKKF